MNKIKTRNPGLSLMLCVGTALVIAGLIVVANMFNSYTDYFITRQDAQMLKMAVTYDYNLTDQLNNLQSDLAFVTSRQGFARAEDAWLETGDAEPLLFRMGERMLEDDPLVACMLALRDGQVLLSTNGQTDYVFPDDLAEHTLWPCIGPNGRLHLGIIHHGERVSYAVLMDLQQYFDQISTLASTDGTHMLLLLDSGNLLLHQWDGVTRVDPAAALTADQCDLRALELIRQGNASGTHLTDAYTLHTPASGSHSMRIAVLPVSLTRNGAFSIAITTDFDSVIGPMQGAGIQLVACGAAMALGMALLVLLCVLIARRNFRADAELRLLRARNEETQRLLQKTQELAHHQRLETIGTLASSIAHEFNNLLTPIMGYSILTLEGLPEGSDELADNVAEIYEASRKAKTIIARLNDLARKQSTLTLSPLSLDDLVRRSLEVAAPAQPAHVEVETRLDCGSARLQGNETQLAQVLLNLVLNAFQAMEASAGKLLITTAADDRHATLTVQDTGTGIPADVLPRIFEPFFTTKESGKGTGLGLAIVHQVVENHHGEITVANAPQGGAVFTVRFPLAENPQNGG